MNKELQIKTNIFIDLHGNAYGATIKDEIENRLDRFPQMVLDLD